MARQKGNSVMHNTRGLFNKQVVFKERAGKVYVAGPPNAKNNRKPTNSQQAVRDKFKYASDFAKMALEDADLKLAYEKAANPSQSAYNVAMTDALTPPTVTDIITVGYRGVIGDSIIIQARDNFKVNEVKVSIFNSLGELIEHGEAVQMPKKLSWNYTVTQANATLTGTTIRATAYDIPENEGSLEATL